MAKVLGTWSSWRTQKQRYRRLRDTGKFTHSNVVSPSVSVVGGDDAVDANGDTVFTTDDVGAGDAGASSDPSNGGLHSVEMDVSGSFP